MKMLTLILMTTFATTTYAQDNSSLKTINQIEEAYNLCLQDAASTMAMQSCSLEANKKAEKELQQNREVSMSPSEKQIQ